jgi:hypothetical protein
MMLIKVEKVMFSAKKFILVGVFSLVVLACGQGIEMLTDDITITSTPPTEATVGVPYEYLVVASHKYDRPLSFSLGFTTSTDEMTIDSESGLFTWTPTQPDPSVMISIEVRDNNLGVKPQSLLITVSSAPDSDGDGVPDDQDPFPDEPYNTPITKAQRWLAMQQNSDGSWGNTMAEKFILTAQVVDALRASGQRSTVYYQGITWLENHATDNSDYQSRRIFSLNAHGDDVSAAIAELVATQDSSVLGRDAWGVSREYLQAPIDTAIVLKSLSSVNSIADIQTAIDYLKAAQLDGPNDQGWPVALGSQSDVFSTAMVVKALVALQDIDASVATLINNAVATLVALVNTSSPTFLQAHTVHAAYLSGNPSMVSPLLTHLSNIQAPNGSWGGRIYDTALVLHALTTAHHLDTPSNQSDVLVPDANLRAAINAALGRNRMDTLDRTELLRLTTLNAANLGISDLTGLEWAINLRFLNISGNNITSLDPISDLALETLVTTQTQSAQAVWDDPSSTWDEPEWQ